MKDSHMSQFVGDGEGCGETVVLYDGAGVLVTHCAKLGQAESVTILTGGFGMAANIFPIKSLLFNN